MGSLAETRSVVRARLRSGDRATTMVEYALLVALVALVCVGPLRSLSDRVDERFVETAGDLEGGADGDDGSGGAGGGGGSEGDIGPGGGGGPGGGDDDGPGGGDDDDDDDGPGGGDDDGPGGGDGDGPGGGDGDDDDDGPGGGDGDDDGPGDGGSSGDGGGSGGSDDGDEDEDEDEDEDPPGARTDWTGSSSLEDNDRWRAEVAVTIRGEDGEPLSGVNAGVNVRVVQVYRTWDGKVRERSWTDQGNLQGGRATFSQGHLATGRKKNTEAVLAMRYEVTGINYYWPRDPAVRWDGETPTITVDAP